MSDTSQYGTIVIVDGGRIKIEKASSFYWFWIDGKNRRISDMRAGYLSHQDCVADAERETAAVVHGKRSEDIYNAVEPESLPWWVEPGNS